MAEVVELHPKRNNKNSLDVVLSGEIQVPPPDALQPFFLASKTERARRIRRVLAGGWRNFRDGESEIVFAVRAAGAPDVAEYALRAMRSVLLELDLSHWQRHPHRTRADVHRLFRKTIARLTPHRGGWRASRPPLSEAR